MPTVIIRNPTGNTILVEPEEVVVKTNQKLTLVVSSESGLPPGTRVRVEFSKTFHVVKTLGPKVRQVASKKGPFARLSNDPKNPADGKFEFDSAGSFETGAITKVPPPNVQHEWKYDVFWGVIKLDPIIKIERGG